MSENLTFSITGEYIVSIARDCMLSEDTQAAYEILESGGIPSDLIYEIMAGKKTLSGENENIIVVKDNNSDKYIKDLHYLFRNIVVFNNKVYKAVAKINVMKKSHEFALKRFELIYKFDNDNIVKFNSNGDSIVFEPYNNNLPPFIMKDCKNKSLDIINMKYLIELGIEDFTFYKDPSNSVSLVLKDIFKFKKLNVEDYEDIYYEELYKRRDLISKYLEKEHLEKIKEYRTKILKQSKSFIQIGKYKIPREPFIKWVQTSSAEGTYNRYKNISVEWTPVTPSGLKMNGDSPYHNDWIIGAGFDLEEDIYKHEITELVYKYISSTHNEIIVLNGNEKIYGKLTSDINNCEDKILLIPHAGIEFFEAAKKAKAVICKIGGPAAHLVLNSKEYKLNICVDYFNYEELIQLEGSDIVIDFEKSFLKF